MPNIYKIRELLIQAVHLYDKILKKNEGSFTVLCFHGFGTRSRYDITQRNFEKIILKIRNEGTEFASLSDLGNTIKESNGKNLGKKRVLITIDDGFKNVMSIRRIVAKYHIPVVLFVLSDPSNANRAELENKSELLSWKEIRSLHREGWTIGSHSATHANFMTLSEKDTIQEIIDSKRIIEKQIGEKIEAIAYPKGFYTSRVIKATKQAKYSYAFTIEAGAITSFSDKYLLPRTIVDSSHKLNEIPGMYSHTWFRIRKLTNRLGLWEKFLK